MRCVCVCVCLEGEAGFSEVPCGVRWLRKRCPVGGWKRAVGMRFSRVCIWCTGPGAYDTPAGERGPQHSLGSRPGGRAAQDTPGVQREGGMEGAVWIAIAFAFGLDISFVWGRKSLRTAECVCGWSGVAVPPSREKFVGLGGVWVGVSFFIVRGSWGPRAPQWSVLFRVGVSLALGRGDCPSPSPSAEERASGASGKGREWEGASARIWRGRRAASRCRWGCRITGLPVGRCVYVKFSLGAVLHSLHRPGGLR